jgi:hypothetical protein
MAAAAAAALMQRKLMPAGSRIVARWKRSL